MALPVSMKIGPVKVKKILFGGPKNRVELVVLIMVSQKTRPGSKTATVMSYECNRNRKARMFHSLV
jgi:hypothetical protein